MYENTKLKLIYRGCLKSSKAFSNLSLIIWPLRLAADHAVSDTEEIHRGKQADHCPEVQPLTVNRSAIMTSDTHKSW